MSEWLKAVEDYYRGEAVDPLVEKILRAIIAWHADGETPGGIVLLLASGPLFQIDVDKQTVKAVIAHIQHFETATDDPGAEGGQSDAEAN